MVFGRSSVQTVFPFLHRSLARRYGIQLRVSKRVNDGGAKIDRLSDTGLTHPEDWDPYDIASMFIESCDRSLMSLSRLELDNFLIPLKTFVADLDISELRDTIIIMLAIDFALRATSRLRE